MLINVYFQTLSLSETMPRKTPARPSSAGSMRSPGGQGRKAGQDWGVRPTVGPRPDEAACISEEVKIGINLAVERFRMNDQQKGNIWFQRF